jgi:crotonobetaine/carnitine-CoA ligase
VTDPQTLAEACDMAAARWGERVALLIDAPREQLSFADLARQSRGLAALLRMMDIEPGDAVAVMLPNIAAYPLCWIALVRLGARIVPINKTSRQADAAHILRHSGAKLLITDAERALMASAMDGVPPILAVESDAFRTACASSPEGRAAGTSATITSIQYTSGTTGFPKGCLLSNSYWLTLARQFTQGSPFLTSDDVLLTAQPFSYIDPHWNFVVSLLAGAKLVVLDGFHPSRFAAKIVEHGVTFFYCLGAMPTLLLAIEPSGYDRAHKVRQVRCSAIPARRHAELEARFGVPWIEAYGTTEAGGVLAMSEADSVRHVGSGSMGTPLPGREVRLLGPDGSLIDGPGEGELLVRGCGMMDAYFGDPVASDAAFYAGWYRTGDLVRVDDGGHHYFVGRSRDMVRRGGENIAAVEVEQLLETHPSVRLSAVVAVKDDLRGEEVKVFLTPREGDSAALDIPALVTFARERLAPFKVPRYWVPVSSLPSTPSERVAKHQLDRNPQGYDRARQLWL